MQLYVARHAQTNYNVEKLCNADPTVDVHLTDVGIAQAKQLAERLGDVVFSKIYISELPRTRETASYLKQYATTPVVVDARLNDNSTGFESQPIEDYLAALAASNDKWHVRLGDGESLADARQRAEAFLEDLKNEPLDTALVVTHGFIVESINGILNDMDFELAATFQITQGDYLVYDL